MILKFFLLFLLKVCNIEYKEVIVPSFSFISTANSVILANGIPVFCDIERETMGLDANKLIELINNHTKIILLMHYGGKICRDIEKLEDIAYEYGLYLIEDNAESFGALLAISYTFFGLFINLFCHPFFARSL